MCVYVQSLRPVWLSVVLWTIAHQAPLSMEFSKQEYWRGLPFPSPGNLPYQRIISHISCISHIGRQILYHCAPWEVPLVSSYVCFNFLLGFTPFIIPFNLLVSLCGFFNVKLSCFSNHMSEFRIATRAILNFFFFFYFLVCNFSVITKSHEIRIALKWSAHCI